MPMVEVECDWCGKRFERARSEVARVNHVYCCKEHASLGNRTGSTIEWLNAASEPDEQYLVQRILLKYMEMRKEHAPDDESEGSPQWERLSIEHSLLLDITRDILSINGKLPPSQEGETWVRG